MYECFNYTTLGVMMVIFHDHLVYSDAVLDLYNILYNDVRCALSLSISRKLTLPLLKSNQTRGAANSHTSHYSQEN
jgi:hypothetical protein